MKYFFGVLSFFKIQRIIGSFDDDDDGSRIRNGVLFFADVHISFEVFLLLLQLASSSKSKLILIQNHLVLVMSQPAILLSRHVFVTQSAAPPKGNT